MYKLAVFDMDGTILDTLEGLAASGNYALEKAGFPTYSVEEYKRFVGFGARRMMELALPEDHRDTETIEKVMDIYKPHYGERSISSTKHYGDLPKVLQKLKDAGVKLAVASNKPPEFSGVYAEHFFGKGFFEYVLGPEGDIPPKPDPKMLLAAIEKCGLTLSDTCYFGDSDVDVSTGINAGVATAGVAWGYQTEKMLLAAGASRILYEYSEILDFVGVAY